MKIIKNALTEEAAELMRKEFIGAHWKRYGTSERDLFKGKDDWYPGEDEVYSSAYTRAREVEKSAFFREVSQALSTHLPFDWHNAAVHAYRMTAGDHFRVHDDSKNGIGFVYYLSKGWKWDWGGLLMVRRNESVVPLKPEFNQMVVIDYAVPHFVSPVAQYALEPRYAIVGFVNV